MIPRGSAIVAAIVDLLNIFGVVASPAQDASSQTTFQSGHRRFFDVQAHRGGRGNSVENTLPSFAWGLIDGATTLELDNGITQDGVVVVWHDEHIDPAKCRDTAPVELNDPQFPYVGKYIANLTLAQIKTLDCGSQRQANHPQQLTYPGATISTLAELFDFARCADPERQILWNIESKIDANRPNLTLGVRDFVQKQHAVFADSGYRESITYQSFDWRTLIGMKALDSQITLSALIDESTYRGPNGQKSAWLGSADLDSFPGPTLGARIAQAAHAIGADILSPATYPSSLSSTSTIFTNPEMVQEAHVLGMLVKPWTVNTLNVAEDVVSWGADGIISDYPNIVRRWAKHTGLSVAPKYPKARVLSCLQTHMHTLRITDS